MPWDLNKCQWGEPAPFTDAMAAAAVNGADFTKSVYVNTSQAGQTRQAYTYVVVKDFRICVVGHIHPQWGGRPPEPGNAFIPGWMNWQLLTPPNAVAVINALPDDGAFPRDDRYPHAI